MEIIKKDGWNLLLAEDLPILEEYNSKRIGKTSQIQSHLLPEPFIGNLEKAKVVFLALNPGYREKEVKLKNGKISEGEDYWHTNERFKKLITDNRKVGQ